jgi:hypothetical protein
MIEGIDVLYVVLHRTQGRLATFLTPYEAGREMARILMAEPDWLHDLRLERVPVLRASDPSCDH